MPEIARDDLETLVQATAVALHQGQVMQRRHVPDAPMASTTERLAGVLMRARHALTEPAERGEGQ